MDKYILASDYFHGAIKNIKILYTDKNNINCPKLKLHLAYNIDESCQFNSIGEAMKLLGEYITEIKKNGLKYDLKCLCSFRAIKI